MLGFLLGLLWLAALKAWLLGHVALDADSLAVADLWNSLRTGGHLGGWIMGPHPYVFPDLGIYALASRFAADVPGRQTAYGLIQGFLLWLFLGRLLRRLGDLDASSASAYAGAGLLLLLACFSATNHLDEAIIPAYHGGALLCCMGFLAWSLGQEGRLSSWPAVLGVAGLIGLVWASDQITPLWALLPCLALSLGLDGPARRRVWGAAALSWGVRALTLACWESAGMKVAHFRWSYFRAHAAALVGSLSGQWSPGLAVAFAPLLLGCLSLVLLVGRERRDRPLYAWYALSVLLTALAGLGLVLLQGSVQARYFLAFAWLSVPLLPFLAAQRLKGNPAPWLAAVLLGLLAWSARTNGAVPVPLRQARRLDGWMRTRGLHHGLAGYFQARPLRLLSDDGLSLEPVESVDGVLRPYAWIADRRVFASGAKVQFVVLNGLDPSAVRSALGQPLQRLQGEGLTVWIYARPGSGAP